jgi:hypothetical protein
VKDFSGVYYPIPGLGFPRQTGSTTSMQHLDVS